MHTCRKSSFKKLGRINYNFGPNQKWVVSQDANYDTFAFNILHLGNRDDDISPHRTHYKVLQVTIRWMVLTHLHILKVRRNRLVLQGNRVIGVWRVEGLPIDNSNIVSSPRSEVCVTVLAWMSGLTGLPGYGTGTREHPLKAPGSASVGIRGPCDWVPRSLQPHGCPVAAFASKRLFLKNNMSIKCLDNGKDWLVHQTGWSEETVLFWEHFWVHAFSIPNPLS